MTAKGRAFRRISGGHLHRPLPASVGPDLVCREHADWQELPDILAAGLLHGMHKIEAGYYDPRFERPGQVEDDYYRFRNLPNGW
jgi:hypothetical protein